MVKVISLSDEAYAKLKSRKGKDSFSGTVLRLIESTPKKRLSNFFGAWSDMQEEALEIKKMVEEDRKKLKPREMR